MQLFSLEHQKAIVTGGAGGLGQAIVAALAQAGAEVVVLDLVDLPQTTKEDFMQAQYQVHTVRGDMSLPSEVERMFQEALALLGQRVDILVNCAGINRKAPAEAVDLAVWNQVLQVNVTAMFQMCQLAGRCMLQQQKGKIINIASICSFIGSVNNTAYSASKGAVVQLTKALSNEWAAKGIQVNAIAPGTMLTNLTKQNSKEVLDAIVAHVPTGRLGNPQDLQGTVIYLASTASDYVTGVVIPVDGGYLCV
jgi:2-deoxy-D-gluconate 3-dehydrogenase